MSPFAGPRTTSLLDANANVTEVIDPLSHTTQYQYDALNRVTVTIDALSDRTTTLYDAAGNVTSITDADLNTSTFLYDPLDRVTSQTDALGHTATFLYTPVGLISSSTDRDGRVTNYQYNSINELTTETWVVSGTTVNTMSFTYDAVGDLLTAANNNGAYTMQYDATDRVTVVNEPFSLTLTFAYDGVGNRTDVQDNFSGNTSYVYDSANELQTVKFSDGTNALRVDLTYTGTNQVASEAYSNNLMGTGAIANTTFLYDAADRITSIQNTSGGASLSSFLYSYDAASRMTVATQNGTPTTYTYDNINQLTGDGTNTFTFDGTGNRTNTGYSTGTENQLLSNGTYSFTYDNEGNETKKTNIVTGDYWSYGYDNWNEMTSAVEKTAGGTTEQSITYKYDAFGNRIEMDVTIGSTTTTTRFGYDGWKTQIDPFGNPASYVGNENWDVWADLNGSNVLVTRYIRGDQTDQEFGRIDSGTPYWVLGDIQGSTRTVLDNNGNIKDQVSYDGWGNATQTNSTYGGRYLYVGREFDSATGLQYDRARYYDPTTGRWISQDPLGFGAGDVNVYRYVGNAPTDGTDPSGLATAGLPIAGYEPINPGSSFTNPISGPLVYEGPSIQLFGAPGRPRNFQPPTNPPQFPAIPPGYVPERTPTGGIVYRRPGTTGDGGTIRLMPPTADYPDGYWVRYNNAPNPQPINPATGAPGSRPQTHIPLPPGTAPPGNQVQPPATNPPATPPRGAQPPTTNPPGVPPRGVEPRTTNPPGVPPRGVQPPRGGQPPAGPPPPGGPQPPRSGPPLNPFLLGFLLTRAGFGIAGNLIPGNLGKACTAVGDMYDDPSVLWNPGPLPGSPGNPLCAPQPGLAVPPSFPNQVGAGQNLLPGEISIAPGQQPPAGFEIVPGTLGRVARLIITFS